jgi:hypothetical protein
MKATALLSFSVSLFLAMPVLAAPPPADSPLAAYPGFGHHEKADDARFDREEMAREHMISRCMEQNGFRYVPTPSIPLESFDTPTAAIAALRDDPNGRYARGLSDDEGTRYRLALYGVEDPMSENADAQPDPADPDAASGGCFGEAMRAMPGVFAAKAALQDDYDAMRRSVMSDLWVRAAERHWASCMEGLGDGQDASPRALEQRQDAELASRIGPTRDQLPAREELAALGEKHRAERRLAMRCAREVDLAGVVAAVRLRYEARFVTEHRQVLDQHLESLREQLALLDQVEAAVP